MSFSSQIRIPNAALTLALLLGIHSLWVLAAELMRPGFALESAFPPRVLPQDINSKRLTANIAASIGFVRGDLWSERVLVDAANVIGDQASPTNSLPTDGTEAVRIAAQRALSSRPIDSRIWLVLATISSSRSEQHERANQQLKMSYYTGPNDKTVIGYRLKFAMDSHALDNADLREAVRREIRTILLRASDMRSAIVSAYRKAQPQDRQFIESIVAATDPNFVATLRTAQSE